MTPLAAWIASTVRAMASPTVAIRAGLSSEIVPPAAKFEGRLFSS